MEDLAGLYRDKGQVVSILRRYMIELNMGRIEMAREIGITPRSLARLLDGYEVTDKVFNRVISYLGLHHEEDSARTHID